MQTPEDWDRPQLPQGPGERVVSSAVSYYQPLRRAAPPELAAAPEPLVTRGACGGGAYRDDPEVATRGAFGGSFRDDPPLNGSGVGAGLNGSSGFSGGRASYASGGMTSGAACGSSLGYADRPSLSSGARDDFSSRPLAGTSASAGAGYSFGVRPPSSAERPAVEATKVNGFSVGTNGGTNGSYGSNNGGTNGGANGSYGSSNGGTNGGIKGGTNGSYGSNNGGANGGTSGGFGYGSAGATSRDDFSSGFAGGSAASTSRDIYSTGPSSGVDRGRSDHGHAMPGLSEVSRPTPSASSCDAPPAAATDVDVRGNGDLPGPWLTWDAVQFPSRVKESLMSAGFPAPSVIQQHAWPVMALGRDLIGVAKTGSGKTLAFLLPPFARLVETRADPRGPPAILVLAPTRELAVQIEQQAKQFGASSGMRAVCLYGGAPKGPQLAELRGRPQVIVATPGRLNDLLEPPPGLTRGVDIDGVRYLVLDEADRMLDMGFEPQIRKIIGGLSKDRQTAMFTATWPASVRRMAQDFLRDPIEVRVGEVDELKVNPDIDQRVMFCADGGDKERRLIEILRDAGSGQAIIFVNTKRMCESVAMRVEDSVTIHGDKDQRERDMALNSFKSGQRRVMVATDVAARGLDIKSLALVINFDPPNRDEDYVHRVGRTGRAGNKGIAVTLLTNEDGTAARFIADIFRKSNIPVPEELERKLASGELRSGGGGGRGGGGGGAYGGGGGGGRKGSGPGYF